MGKFVPSKNQKDIFEFIKNSDKNAIISAVAGSGKTTTLIEALKLIPLDKRVLFMAFNKSIANELADRVPKTGNIVVKTVHGFGHSILSGGMEFKIDNSKYKKLFNNIVKYYQKNSKDSINDYKFDDDCFTYIRRMSSSVKNDELDIKKFTDNVISLCNLGRLHLVDVISKSKGVDKLKELSDFHSIDNEDGECEVAWYLIKLGMFVKDTIDFTDMIFFPTVFDFPTETFDYVFIDECQDLNTSQRVLMQRAIKPETGRFVAVGDPKQAIYGFAGADHESFKKLCDIPNTIQLPLSITYRCHSQIVKMVTSINPFIKSHKKNNEGIIDEEFSYKNLQDGDMVLCRQTFPVVALCIRLLSEGKKAYIIGSDIGLSLVSMIKDCERITEEFTMENVFSRLYHEKEKLIDKIATNHGISREDAMEDNHVVLYAEKINVIEALSRNITNPLEVIEKINTLFSDNKKAGVCLSNIHKSKGLEAERVFIIHRELMPSKNVKSPWEREQEQNLIYVAYTRAKKTLGFIQDFDAWKTHESQSQNIKPLVESKHLGHIGAKMNFDATITSIRVVNGKYGETQVYEMVDSRKNVLSKFGEIDRRFLNDDGLEVNVGSKISFYGIISGHKEFRGVKITQIGKISMY